MEFEFDKEIDALLRQTAKGGKLFAAVNLPLEHLDAEEISMFAENALPEKMRPRVVKHLADCDRCRTILSNVIVLNSEAEAAFAASVTLTDTAAETVVTTAIEKIPWYQKLFSTKNLAFGLGSLALVFALGIGFLVVQNALSPNSEVAQANTNTADADEAAADQKAPAVDLETANTNAGSAANANTSVSEENASSVADTELADNTAAPSPAGPSEKKESSEEADKKSGGETLGKTTSNQPGRDDRSRTEPRDVSVDDDAKVETADLATGNVRETEGGRRAQNEKNVATSPPPPPVVQPNSPVTARSNGVIKPKKSEDKDEVTTEKRKTPSPEGRKTPSPSRRVNGKLFTQRDGAWYDSAYKGQATTDVKRGTDPYNELDEGLKSIGNQLSGTVVVVWKSKAYKIQ